MILYLQKNGNEMDKTEFLKQQYLKLREEIKETKSRIFKTMGFGLVVVPASHFLSIAYKIDTVDEDQINYSIF